MTEVGQHGPWEASIERERYVARSKKVRFVVGLFDAVPDLRRALDALQGAGLTCRNICVLTGTSGRTMGPAEVLNELKGVGLSQIVVRADHPSEPSTTLSSPPEHCGLEACDPSCGIDPRLVGDFHRWAFGRQARQLEDQLQLGGSLLFVRVSDDDEQHAVGSMLLQHARNGVQTHEVKGAD